MLFDRVAGSGSSNLGFPKVTIVGLLKATTPAPAQTSCAVFKTDLESRSIDCADGFSGALHCRKDSLQPNFSLGPTS